MNKIFDYSAIASGLILLFLSILTFCDVFGRRFLNSPVTGTIELVEIGMALVAFLAMPRAFFLNANVSADFINNLNKDVNESNNNVEKQNEQNNNIENQIILRKQVIVISSSKRDMEKYPNPGFYP